MKIKKLEKGKGNGGTAENENKQSTNESGKEAKEREDTIKNT